MKISLILPTRGRHKQIRRMLESAINLAEHPENIEAVLWLDDDDDESIKEFELLQKEYNIYSVIDDRGEGNLSIMWNRAQAIATGEIFMHCGDDIIFRTKNWDTIVVNKFLEFEDRIVFVYGYDGACEKNYGTHGFIHKNWIETIGYFLPPYFACDFNDTWLNEVSNLINRHCYVEIYTEHMHYTVGKSEYDIIHSEREERNKRDNCPQIYKDRIQERIIDADKLKNFIDAYKEIEESTSKW